jgi:hypothetical protein
MKGWPSWDISTRAEIGGISGPPRECSPQPTQNPFWSSFKFVLPDSHYFPAGAPEFAADESVTFPVGRQFLRPEPRIVLGLVAAFWTAMPKAAVHEHGDALSTESKIRSAQDLQMPTPTANMPTSQQARQSHFSREVPTRPNSCHDLGTLFSRKYVRHRRN